MTKKRFTVPENYRCIQDNLTKEHYLCEDKTEAINLTYLLNELAEENQQCKEYNAKLYSNSMKSEKQLLKQIKELKEENKELKRLLKTVIDERVIDYPLLCKLKEMVKE